MLFELPPLPKRQFDRKKTNCRCSVGEHTFILKVVLPMEVDYLDPESPEFPKVDLWELQSTLRDLGLISIDYNVCGIQPQLGFISAHKGNLVRYNTSNDVVYNWQ